MLKDNDVTEARGIDDLTYPKADLLKAVRNNREKHRRTYETASREYRKRLIEKCQERLRLAKRGESFPDSMGMVKPAEFLKEYDRAIKMLEMTTLKTITVDTTVFKQLIMDEWPWASQFDASTMAYNSPRPGRKFK